MPYPMAQVPRAGDFIAKAEALGAQLRNVDGLVGPRGPAPIRYLQLERDGRVRRTEPLPESDDEQVFWDLARRLCRQLGLDPRDLDIGLDLG